METVDVTIIGAGVVGLSIAAELSKKGGAVYVIERNSSFGQETSSRNSEVIHAGIYYPKGSLKARLCVEGNRLLYEICEKNGIPHKRLGKIIAATNGEEAKDLQDLLNRGRDNGVCGLKLLTKEEVAALEPNVRAVAALLSPETGVVDSHKLMEYFEFEAKKNGAEIVYNTNVIGLEKLKDGYKVTVLDSDGTQFSFISKVVINSAGLESDRVAETVGIDVEKEGYTLKYCKGEYFRVGNKKDTLINMLVYPVPEPKGGGLGIHATLDMAHGLRLGPDDEYIGRENVDYKVNVSKIRDFCESVKKFLPFIEEADLYPDTVGIRPKLQGPGEDFRDFLIKHEEDLGFPGFVNLIGIESPGLTAAPAIARLVSQLI